MIKYRNEKDKCFGVVGMAIGMTIWDAEDMFIKVSLDESGFDCLQFTQDFLFIGDPAISPKISWQHRLKDYKIMMGITISNVLCRSLVLDGKSFGNKERQELLDTFIEIGDADYSLTKEECSRLFDKSYEYLQDLYRHQRVKSVAKQIASTLAKSRQLSASEISDFLSQIVQ